MLKGVNIIGARTSFLKQTTLTKAIPKLIINQIIWKQFSSWFNQVKCVHYMKVKENKETILIPA